MTAFNLRWIVPAIIWLSFSVHVFSQGKITIINEGQYVSYFSADYKEPLYVVYHLYKGGGNCKRESFRFKVTRDDTATPKDYSHSGYDEGHLANAKDFAYNCTYEEKTFRFYNCLPQTPRQNRGIWKSWETKIRIESQTKHLLIICGGIFGKKKIGNQVVVPDYCWKIVYEENGSLLHCLLFPNNKSNTYSEISVNQLKNYLGYELVY